MPTEPVGVVPMPPPALLELSEVGKSYPVGHNLFGPKPQLQALAPVSLSVGRGEILAVVGESGCGKSTLGRIMAAVLAPTTGTVALDGVVLGTGADTKGARRQVQLIHQDPYSALNPRKTVQSILTTPLVALQHETPAGARRRAAELLELVGLSPVGAVLPKYPYQLSGGQRQRVVIARALTVNPKVLVADEAVSMIDVSLRQSILATLAALRDRLGMAVVFITHDLAQAHYFAAGHRMMVMYAGHVMEYGATADLIREPHHPYTAILRASVLDPDPEAAEPGQLDSGVVDFPDLTAPQQGCIFAARCPMAQELCRTAIPPLRLEATGRQVACHYSGDVVAAELARHADVEMLQPS